MFHRRLVLGAALLCCCTGESLTNGPPETVLAFAGEDVILPCSFITNANDDFPAVEWSKEGLDPNVIFLYREGCETYEMKNQAFEYRTSLITKELKNGNISLRISDVQLSDAGKYQCMRLWSNPNTRDITTLELVVGAASEPKLSVVSAESGEVTLQCEANCWLPEPEIMFLDHQGNNISAEDPRRDYQNSSGCYTVRRRVTLQSATNRVTCRVHQPNISQTRDTNIFIPAGCLRSCTLITVATIGAPILVLLGCGLAVFIWRRCHKSAEGQKLPVTRQSSDESTSDAENQLLLKQRDRDTIEQLNIKVADLKLKLCEKDKIILKLQNDSKSRLNTQQHTQPMIFCSPSKSSLDPKVFSPPSDLSPEAINLPTDHNLKPTASTNSNPPNSVNIPQNKRAKRGIARQESIPAHGHPIQRSHRKNSCPANLNWTLFSVSSTSTSKEMLGVVDPSNSASHAWPRPNVTTVQRRHSYTNRFSLLAHVTEESEQLVSEEKEPRANH